MLEARNVTLQLGSRRVLDRVSVQVRPGRISVLCGPSGAGKTSLLRCLALLVPATSGEVALDGDIPALPLREGTATPWPRVTAVFQQHFLWPHLTLRQNIELPIRLRRTSTRRSDELIERMQLSGFIDQYPGRSSMGQRQRVAIARALALEPTYVLLDEVTSALDIEQASTVLELVGDLARAGAGVMLITHELDFARAVLEQDASHEFIFLDEGCILETGGVDALLRSTNARVAAFTARIGYSSRR